MWHRNWNPPRHRIGLASLLALLASPGQAAGGCSSEAARQFDFWVGLWRVTTADGQFAGVNRIESRDGGCTLFESWISGKGGYSGSSVNWYGSDARWHQQWVDSSGETLQLTGGFADDQMVLEGTTAAAEPSKPRVRQRIAWSTPRPGVVRQLWQSSTDDGQNYTTAFDGTYVRIDAAAAAPGLLGRLSGSWVGTGTIQGREVAVQLTLTPVLANRFVELHWSNLGGKDQPGSFEGRAVYQSLGEGKYSARWWDSLGTQYEITGTERGNELEALWGTQGRTRYVLQADGALEVIDSIKGRNGAWRDFGRSQLRRSTP
jgi:hypothetical protein